MEWWRDAVGPNEVIDVETLLVTYYLFAENLLFNEKHLRTRELGDYKNKGGQTWQISATLNILLLSRVFCASITQGRSTSFAEYMLSAM